MSKEALSSDDSSSDNLSTGDNLSTRLATSVSENESLMNLLEWTQQKLDSGIQIVKEVGNRLDIKFLKESDKLDKQVHVNNLWLFVIGCDCLWLFVIGCDCLWLVVTVCDWFYDK